MMGEGLVYTREDHADRLKKASDALANIMFSSAYNAFIDPEFKDISDFDEFSDVFNKLRKWSIEYENRLNSKKSLENT